ncbi:hypothetical protein C2F74_RS18930 [Vibrio parahaemolyticus]|nr:hypothetical protein [Vibrio parahaemolyticus]
MQGNPMLRLLNRAHAYEAFILPRIEGREALYPDDLARLRKSARQRFPELRPAEPTPPPRLSAPSMMLDAALFEDMLHRLLLKTGFKVAESAQQPRYYYR